MPKSDLPIAAEYAPVADRIALFYERFPEGRIITHLTMHNEREIAFRASVYRTERSRTPAATGWASERIGDGDVNTVACLENTETSAIGRALANLGFVASNKRPSNEEMAKADRARRRLLGQAPRSMGTKESFASDAFQAKANIATDVIRLIRAAERLGLGVDRAGSLIGRVAEGGVSDNSLDRLERALRAWLTAREGRRFGRSRPPDG